MKIKRRERSRDQRLGRWIGRGMIAALVASVAVFVAMLQIEKRVLSEGEKGFVVMTVAAVPKGQLITEENRDLYFRLSEINAELIPERAVQHMDDLNENIALIDVGEGTMVISGMFAGLNEQLRGIREPVIAGLKADDIYQVVGGLLRAGDRVHVYGMTGERSVELIWGDLLIQEVFDQAGNKIANDDLASAAQRVNVYIDRADVEKFYSALSSGTLRVVKVCEESGGTKEAQVRKDDPGKDKE